jgi:toxin ParE1/3/4
MSFRKPSTLKLSPRARQDFIDILRFTGETWGQNQLLAYRDKINEALQAIGNNPQLGHHRDDLPATHLAYLAGSHVIVYRTETGGIGVVRILQQRISLARHVSNRVIHKV